MRLPLSAQSFRAVRTRKLQFPFVKVSCRALSSSRICLEEVKPTSESQPEGQTAGVPLAFELGGISIKNNSNSGQRRTLAERLAARRAELAARPKEANAESASENQTQTTTGGVIAPRIREARTLRDASPTSPDPRRAQDRRGQGHQARPPPRHGQKQPPRDGQKFPPRGGQKQSAQARQRPGGARRPGQGQEERDSGRPGRPSRPMKARQARPGRKRVSNRARAERVTDPDLNDYPYEDWNRPPVRQYDDDGILKLKGEHVQISPVARPILPRFSTPPITTSDAPKTASTTNNLRVLSYAERAPVKGAVQPDHNVKSVVDNASLALGRVRDLDLPHRRDALNIVEKMANKTGDYDKEPTATA